MSETINITTTKTTTALDFAIASILHVSFR